MHTLMKNVMIIPLVTVTFYLFRVVDLLGVPQISTFFGGLNH